MRGLHLGTRPDRGDGPAAHRDGAIGNHATTAIHADDGAAGDDEISHSIHLHIAKTQPVVRRSREVDVPPGRSHHGLLVQRHMGDLALFDQQRLADQSTALRLVARLGDAIDQRVECRIGPAPDI